LKASNIILTLAVLLLVAASVMTYRYGKLTLQIAMADDQVKIFESMRLKALASSPLEAAECLLYVQNYYPSGSKQVAGSRIDQVVEAARASAMREITSHLRFKTTKDFGNDPLKWIESLKQDGRN
jgi:predicted phosphohydrolase